MIAMWHTKCIKFQLHFVASVQVQFEAMNAILRDVFCSLQMCKSNVAKSLRMNEEFEVASAIVARQYIHA